jgi:hypothetical protein
LAANCSGSFTDTLREKGIDPAQIVETRFAPDMMPFRFQVVSVVHHLRGAMEA